MEEIEQHAQRVNNIANNPYFAILRKVPTKDSFLRSQQSFITAIDFWSRILASMLIHMPGDKERTVIMKNLWDEHGCGDPAKSHVETFKEFMVSMGYDDELKVEYLNTDTGVFAFITRLNGLFGTQLQPTNYGDKEVRERLISAVSALAMIEFTYVTVSKCIHQYALNFLEPETISHYSVHETVDVDHARELFSLVEENWVDLRFRDKVKSGIETGYQMMYDLYENLSKHLKLVVPEKDQEEKMVYDDDLIFPMGN